MSMSPCSGGRHSPATQRCSKRPAAPLPLTRSRVRGRKPKPTYLKLVTGNPGRRPIKGDREPAAGGLPQAPAELAGDARTEWRRVARTLHRAGLLATLDRAALAAYCQAFARW